MMMVKYMVSFIKKYSDVDFDCHIFLNYEV